MSASFFIPHFSRSSLRQRRIESDADRSSMPQRRIESNAERCCGRDRCHSGGFLLRIMPPSWRPVPACARHDKLQAGHSPLPQRKLESDAEDRCHNGCCRRAIPHCSNDRNRRNYSSLRQRRIESDADHVGRQGLAPLRSFTIYSVNYFYFCSSDYICSMERNGMVLVLYIDS